VRDRGWGGSELGQILPLKVEEGALGDGGEVGSGELDGRGRCRLSKVE